MNTKIRCDIVRSMEMLVRSVNNEDFIDTYLRIGVADGDIRPDTTDEDLEYYIVDDAFADLMDTLLRVMRNAQEDGGLYIDGIVIKAEEGNARKADMNTAWK